MTETAQRCPIGHINLQIEPLLEHDPFAAMDEWREQPPFWCEDHGGFWAVTRYEDCRQILQDAETFASGDAATVPAYQLAEPLIPSFIGPPDVQKFRALVLPRLTPRRVAALEPQMREISRSLIAELKSRGSCDIIEDFGRQYPIRVFVGIFGLPAERQEEFRAHAETFLHDVEHAAEAWSRIRDILREQLEEKRKRPTDDILGAIASGEIDGAPIDMDAAINLASTVFVGGLDTLPSNIGWSFRYLAQNPAARKRIIEEPEVIPRAVEEFLRMWTVTAKDNRYATKDVTFNGVHIRKGDRVQVLIGLANHDGSEFENPLTIDFDRVMNRHIAFAVGPHRCLGSHLARHELMIALEEWHAAIPDYRIPPGKDLKYHGGSVFAIDTLTLEWEVAQ